MTKIDNHRYTIEEAFRECFYIVPDYQREYVWTDKEVQQLLEDINEQIDSAAARDYFIGTVLVSPTGEKNHYEVIDGQQRLTTFFLLLCALKHRFRGEPQAQTISGLIATSFTSRDGDTRTSLKLDPRYENASEVVATIASADADPAGVKRAISTRGIASFGSLENLVNAYATIYQFLQDNYEDLAALRKYWGYLANYVVFIQIATDVSSALKIFETINERGVGLNPMDLLKNLLFTHVRTDEFRRLKDEWAKITKPLEKAKEKPLRFLRYFLMANFPIKNSRGDNVVREDEIYDWLTDKANASMCGYAPEPFAFVRNIARNVELYLGFAEGRSADGTPSIAMDSLRRLTGAGFSLHYVLLLAVASLPKALFEHFVRQLESFLFYYIFTKTPTKDLERSFSLWADELREITSEKDAAQLRSRLNDFMDRRFKASMIMKEHELSDALRRYSLGSMQKYRTHYLLAKLTQHVDMAYKGMTTPGSLDQYAGVEIEHILPNNPQEDLRASFAASNPGANYDEIKNRLGNLTLLEKPINIIASNGYYEKKKPEFRKSKYYLTSSLVELVTVGKNSSVNRINERLQAFDIWSAKAIEQRQDQLIELARDVWQIVPAYPVSKNGTE